MKIDISHNVGTSNNIGNSSNTNTNITAGNTTATNFDREGYTIPKMKRRTDERMSRAFNMQANKPAANGAAPGISADAGASRVTTSATNDIHEPDATTIVSMSDYTTMSRTYSTTGSASSSSSSISLSTSAGAGVGIGIGAKHHFKQQGYQRPILVGYAFGPKKMSTMSVVMAEASMAVSTVVTHIPPRPERRKKRNSFTTSNSNSNSNSTTAGTNSNGIEDIPSSSLSSLSSVGDFSNSNCHHAYVNANGNANANQYTKDAPKRRKLNPNDECHDINSAEEECHEHECCSVNSTCNTEVDSIISTSCVTTYSTQDNDTTSTTISCIFPCSKNSSATTASTAATATATTKNTTSSFKPFPGKYIQIPQHHQHMRVSFVPLDLNSPLEEQHGGKFDAILHKMTEDILCKSQQSQSCAFTHADDFGFSSASTSSTNNSRTSTPTRNLPTNISPLSSTAMPTVPTFNNSDKEAMRRIQRLLKYKHDHPACCLVDHPTNVEVVMSRSKITHTLTQCLRGVTTKSGIAVNTPRFLVLENNHSSNNNNNNNNHTTCNIAKQIEEAPFTYPLIVKPLIAAGTSESHRMGILLGRNGISKIHTPCLLQEYANHDGLLYKVYVLGSKVWVFPRPSLPNLPTGESLSSVLPHYVEFDSQRPYPKISDFGVVPASNTTTKTATISSTDSQSDSETKEKSSIKANSFASVSSNDKHVTSEEIRPVADCIRRAFGLQLFGFDILVINNNSRKEMFVVDVNYFPSYKEVTNFSELLAQYLAQCGIEGRVRSFESER